MNRQDELHRHGTGLWRRRSILLATAVALAIGGYVAGKGLFPEAATPASAQITLDRPAVQFSFADVVERVSPAVVSVRVRVDRPESSNMERFGRENMPPQMEEFFRRFFGDRMPDIRPGPRDRRVSGQGSGFFISADGYVVTNNHVVDKASEVEITTHDTKTYTAQVVGTDPRTDIALLKIDGRKDFPWVKFSNAAPRVGEWVLAVGNPFGLGGTVTAGIVSARGRDIGANVYDDFIQIDAAVNRGNSGGPTFNVSGEVIGVNTAIVSPSGGNVGIAFAIPAESVRRVVEELRETGTVTRGYIGVQIQPINKELADTLGLKDAQGALVAEVQPGTPAEKAGLRAGDAILSVDGERLRDARDLSRRVASRRPGATVRLQIVRDRKEQTLELTLARLPDQVQTAERRSTPPSNEPRGEEPRLGLTLAPASSVAGAGTEGVVVTEVDPNGPAAERGVRSGDVILEVGGKAVSSPKEVRDALQAARGENKNSVLLRLRGESGNRFVAVPVGRG